MTATLPKITFTKAQGGLGRPLPNDDNVSGIIAYISTLPTGFGTTRVKKILDLDNAETLGIVPSTDFAILHYHISEFFRINPGAELWVGIFVTPTDYNEFKTMQYATGGRLRQLAFYDDTVFSAGTFPAEIAAIQLVCNALQTENQPLSVLVGLNIHGITTANLTTLTNLRGLASDCPNVSVVIGEDGACVGAALHTSLSKSITCLGACLGAVSLAAVNESIAWVAKFNMAYLSTELDTPALANGDLISVLTPTQIEAVNTLGYIFLLKHIGTSGTYINDSHTCTDLTNDYTYIELERVIDKAIRNVRTYMLPELNRPVYVDPTSGKLRPDMICYLQDKAGQALEEMSRAGELSGWVAYIDPDQSILVNSELNIVIKQVPVGVARQIKIKIGYTTSIN